MLKAKKWLAMLLAVSLLFNLIPINVLAEEPSQDPVTDTSESSEVSEVTEASETTEATEPSATTEATEATDPTVDEEVPAESEDPSSNDESQSDEELENFPVPLYNNSFATSFAAVLANNGYSDINSILEEDGDSVTLTVSDGKILALLSQQQQAAGSNYQNWTIKLGTTGTVNLDNTFQGLGSEVFPFQGTISGDASSIKTVHTLFNWLSSTARAVLSENFSIKWAGPQNEAIFAENLILKSDYTIPMALSFVNDDKGACSPFLGKVSGAYTATLPTLDYSENVDYQSVVKTDKDFGLLCRVIDAGASLKVSELKLPSNTQLQFNTSANTGGLVGSMGDNSKLILSQTMALNLLLIGNNAGGLVGKMGTDATIEFQSGAGVDVAATLKATNAGGIAGEVTTQTGPLSPYSEPSAQAEEDAPKNVRIRSVKANGEENAGILYGICTVTGSFDPFAGVTFTDGAVREVSGAGNCGGVFGTLTINDAGKCSISTDISSTLKFNNGIAGASNTGNTTQYGGIAGTLSNGARKNPLVVDGCSIKSIVDVGTDTNNYPKYIGGIVAVQGTNTTVDAKNSTVTISNPKTPLNTYGIGGLCTTVGDGALLMADTMTVVIDAFVDNQGSSGVAASTGQGAVVYLKKSLDLSNCLLSTCAYSGQIVGKQESSLIYAPGVAISRLNTDKYSGVELDDIGNYGELYRVANFLTVSSDYSTSLPKLTGNESVYTLSSVQDYACLALAWQSRGYFPTVDGITNSNWSSLKSSTIQLNGNIVMTGCGIGGLTRDYDKDSAKDTFSGLFDGNGKTITLDIGAENSANTVSKGDGRIYWHNATGLFAALGTNAQVNGLTLAGNIRLSNNRTTPMRSGALTAYASGSVTISGVSTEAAFDAICNGGNVLYLGGLVGLISGTSNTTLTLETGTTLAAEFTLTHSGNGAYNHIGGAIGGIDGKSSVTLTCNGTTLGGQITSTGSISNLYAGGLVGTITPANGGVRAINLTNLTVKGFSLSGNASERMGGILGGIWADADVTVGSLTIAGSTDENGTVTPDAKLQADGQAAMGGLVYRASGKWTVSSANLAGLTITANSSTKALGLLVCHGEPYQEPINSATANTRIGGLYLEMTQYWGSGYKVPAVSSFGSGVFDEFVAYTAYRDSNGSYDITHNGSGIISLQTEEEGDGTYSVHMTSGDRNTYENRTTVGKRNKTNPYSRYYYNLASIMVGLSDENDTTVDTAKELLIWSVGRYADSTLRKHFKDLWKETTIGGTDSNYPASFDMDGLSYYPIDVTNANVTVQYADIMFYNNEIEEKETPKDPDKCNKSTRGIDSNSESSSHTQHYTMHCALFRDFKAEDITKTENYTLTVNGVSFAGTVGVVNNGSGALVCGNVAGQTSSGNTSVCKVVLADADNASNAVTLNGISIVPAGGYTPVLINKIGDYSDLSAKYITTGDKQTALAGSSLIGDVGSDSASKLNIAFGGTIKLREDDSPNNNQVFTRATLLNSLRYATGSAVYNFPKEKDYQNDVTYVHNATHGWELGSGVSVEYVDENGDSKLGRYQGSTEYVSKNSTFNKWNDFSSDLPYVYDSPATTVDPKHTVANKWHELAVNLPSTKLETGCGTYGHPYQVNALTFRAIANFVNGGDPVDGWMLCVPKDPTTYHSDTNSDYTLKYENGIWKNVTDASNVSDSSYTTENVRTHLQSAYYQLSDNVTLSDFHGIGATEATAFKGVIDGNGKTITLTGGSSAFIKYSYGSVVRNVTFDLQQTPTLTWVDPGRTDNLTKPQQAPGTFFGGVIGCVLGGDNIIDGVTVKSTQVNVTPSGTNSHLVPVGGYVGVIAGGGVIFRGDYSSVNTGITGTDAQLYRNPIIGRVLGGYAFYEAPPEGGTAPNNGNKDYKINTLSGSNHLSWNGSTLTVNDAQGLLILSAIVSSGAGSTNSNAYSNGVARNAKYTDIGADTEPDDYSTAKNEGAISYLSTYVTGGTSIRNICTSSTDGITIQFAQGTGNVPLTFDMSTYGNGYRGLSARYVSNAAFTSSGVDASAVVMRVKTFNGQNAKVQNINMDVREYHNDDFHMASMGGIFNIVWTQKQSGGGGVGSDFAKNLTLTNCKVSLKYVDSEGVVQNEADNNTFARKDGMRAVSVGGFIGMANDIDASSTSQKTFNHNYLFSNIHIRGNSDTDRCVIFGPNSAGSLIGATAMASTEVKGYPGKLLANGKWALFGPSFLNCSYCYINVTGGLAAGGLIGDAYTNGSSAIPNFYGLGLQYLSGSAVYLASYTSCTVTDETLIVGQNSTITASAKGSIAGGLFGGAGMRVGVNDPEVNTKFSAIAENGQYKFKIINAPSEIKSLRLENVSISVSTTTYDPGNVDRPDNSVNNAYAAGIIGRIGNVNPSCFYDIRINSGGVTSTQATTSRVGGIQGSGHTNSEITMERCEISSYELSGANTGGFLGNGQDPTGFKLNMSDCKLVDSTVFGTKTAGGLVGDAKSFYYLHNILIKNTSITASTTDVGRLFGKMTVGANFGIYAAGISVYADNEEIQIPAKDGNADSFNGYIAYADYAGTETAVTGQASPYVTVNPNFKLNGTEKTLYGDAVGKIPEDKYNSVAARIWADHKTDATGKKNLVSYQNVTSIAQDNAVPEVLSFQTFQKYDDEESASTNFPVLVIKGGDASPILNYLNVITNNGYKTATEKASSYVTVEDPKVYYYNKETNQFRVSTDDDAPASIIKTATNEFEVKAGSYDNTRDRFTLLEFKFKTTINGANKYYTVSIPVVVERELQYDFMATFTPGTVFNKAFYSKLNAHILESSGTPITAYLTYRYNRDKNSYVEYDWQSYLTEDGLDLLIGSQAMDKTLTFDGGLPVNTQLILIDCQNGNQAYKYKVTSGSGKAVNLSAFTSVCDDKVSFRPSLGVALGIEASVNSTEGKFVRTTDSANAILLRDGNYYRLAEETDSNTVTRYTLTVPDLKANTAEENYYLIVTVPATDDPTFKLNGNLSSALTWGVPSSGTQVHRYDPTIVDGRSQTESTYQISSGYVQSLTARPEPEVAGDPVDVASVSTPLKIDLLDTISFDTTQLYNENDKLYLKFSASLMSYLKGNDQKTTSKLVQFPVGTRGTVNFYVHDENGDYYLPTDTGWVPKGKSAVSFGYDWESNGANIELPLSRDGRTALDLSAVRTAVTGQATGDTGKILVTVQMDVYFGSENILKDTIPASANGLDAYAQLHYVSRISTLENSLDTSTVRETETDNVKYYRRVVTDASLSMDASNIDQLGVNPLQLVAEYQGMLNGRNASRIELVTTLDLVTPEKAQAFLEKTQTLRFSLSLSRRNGEQNGEKYFEPISPEDANALLAVKWSEASEAGTFGWSYDIPRSSFTGDNVDPQLFNGTMFTIPLTAYVYTDPTNFANYKLEVSVSFLDANKNELADLPIMDNKDAYVVYTYACIKPTFYEPTGN